MLDRTTPPALSDFPQLTLPEFQEHTLANGVRMLVLDAGDEPVNRVTFLWPAGQLDVDSPAASGLMTNLLTEGCGGLDGKAVTDILESNGAWLKASATRHSTLLSLHSLNSTANIIFPLLGKIIAQSEFPSGALESWKMKCASEKETLMRKPSFQATLLARDTLYGKSHPLARAVMPADIRAVRREDVVTVHRGVMMANAPVIFLSGRIPEGLLSLASSVFGAIPFNTLSPGRISRKISVPPPFDNAKTVRKLLPASLQTGVRIQIPAIPRTHPDYEPLRFATVALGGYFGSRLMSNIREDKGYTYGITANLLPSLEGGDVVISCECDNRYAEATVNEILAEIHRLATEDIDTEELETVRNVLTSAMAGILDSPFSISAFRELSESFNLDGSIFARQFAAAQTVSPDTIKSMAKKYLLNTPAVIALAGGTPS